MNLLVRFYKYQDERFPIKYLGFTTIAVVMSSAAVLSYQVSAFKILANYFACLAFLYHIRVIDESRDYKHDKKYHSERPIHRGLITIKELMIFNVPGLILFTVCSIYFGYASMTYCCVLLLFSWFAWKDFFLSEKFKKEHFYLYNIFHMSQIILLQLFMYVVFTGDFNLNNVMWIHLLFVIFNTAIIEFLRKIKTSNNESKGEDTYSWHLGYEKSLYVFYFFILLNFFTFIWMIYTISPDIGWYLYTSLMMTVFITISIFTHLKLRSKRSENLLLITTLVNYVGLNFLIYFYNI